MTLYELIESGYMKTNKFNCSEALMYGANEAYQLKMDENYLRMSAGFGHGMALKKECGVITGMTLVLSLVFESENDYHHKKLRRMIKKAILQFEKEFDETNCGVLKKNYYIRGLGCLDLVLKGAKILDDLIIPTLNH